MSDLARGEALYARISVKRRRAQQSTPAVVPTSPASSPPDAQTLICLAHSVLVRYMPGAVLPGELAKLRALLDPHMFGRDNRIYRDDVVRIARQIDDIRLTQTEFSESVSS